MGLKQISATNSGYQTRIQYPKQQYPDRPGYQQLRECTQFAPNVLPLPAQKKAYFVEEKAYYEEPEEVAAYFNDTN